MLFILLLAAVRWVSRNVGMLSASSVSGFLQESVTAGIAIGRNQAGEGVAI
jgi:hypothetical protein